MNRIKSEAGFTLVELLVTAMIGGLLASAMLSLMLGQSRFFERTDDQIWAEQSNRATFDLVSSELRMASRFDLLAAQSDSVAVRFDIMRAIVCDSVAADQATKWAIIEWVPLYDRVPLRKLSRPKSLRCLTSRILLRPHAETFDAQTEQQQDYRITPCPGGYHKSHPGHSRHRG